MAVATFDTLKYAKALKAAGVPSDQAEAQTDALQEAFQVNLKELVTKDDLKLAITELTAKIDSSATSLKSETSLLKWMLGVNVTVTVGILIRLLVFRGQF